MTPIKLAATIAGLMLISATPPAMAFSTESGPVSSDGTSQIVDPDEQLDEMADPSSNPGQGTTLNLSAPIGNGGSISTFQGDQPPPASGPTPLFGDPGN